MLLVSIGTLAWAPPKPIGDMPVSALFVMILVTATTVRLHNLASLIGGNIVKGTIYQAAGADRRE
jgi:SulP family sulfate permease